MRWFLTDEALELESALRAAGEEVVSGPEHRALAYVRDALFSPAHYPLDDLTAGARADVVVLVDPVRAIPIGDVFAEFGYARGHAKRVRQRRATLVMWARDDATTWRRYRQGAVRSCACTPGDVAVYVTGSEEVADARRGGGRVARWSPGEDASKIIAAVLHARSGRSYSPRADGHAWG